MNIKYTLSCLLLYGLILSMMTGCISYKEVRVEEIKSVRFKDNNISSGKIVTTLRVNNPNNFTIKIKDYDLRGYIDEADMGKLSVDEKIIIPKNSTQDYDLTLQPDLGKILGVLPSLLMKGSAEASIKGKVKVKALIFSKKFDVDLRKKVSASDFQ